MNSRFLKPVAAVLLAVGLSTVSVAAPADAAILKKAPAASTADTGWGRLSTQPTTLSRSAVGG